MFKAKVSLDFLLLCLLLTLSLIPYIFNIDIMDFNFAVNFLFFCILLPFVYSNFKSDELILSISFVALISLLSAFTFSSLKYTILEINKLLLPLFLLLLVPKVYKASRLKLYYYFSIAFVVLQLILVFMEFSYWKMENYRFHGSLQNVNIISNLIMLLFVYIVEYQRIAGLLNKFRVMLSFVIFSFLILLTGTRSALIGILYFIYIFISETSRKSRIFVLLALVIISSVIIISYGDVLSKQLRFDADASTFTRLSIYTSFFEKIKESYFVIPNGIAAHRSFMDKYFWGYPVHNDFLQYTFDMGIVFYLFIYVLISRFFSYCKHEKKRALIILIMFSTTALHNELFSIYIWIPLYMILSLLYESKGEKNEKDKGVSHSFSL